MNFCKACHSFTYKLHAVEMMENLIENFVLLAKLELQEASFQEEKARERFGFI